MPLPPVSSPTSLQNINVQRASTYGLANAFAGASNTTISPRSVADCLKKSGSLPDIAIDDSTFSYAERSGGGTLWQTQPGEFNQIRKGLCQLNNEKVLQFATVPLGIEVNLSRGNPVTAQNYTQPTSRTCHLTSLLSATHDLLAPYFPEEATVTDKLHRISNVLTDEEREHLFTDGFSLQQLTDIGNRLVKKCDPPWEAKYFPTPGTSRDTFVEQLKQLGDMRLIVNFGGASLYQLGKIERYLDRYAPHFTSKNSGHFTHVDKMKKDENGNIHLHLVEHANYKYGDNPWIPLTELYESMKLPGTTGDSRGYMLLSKKY